MKFNEYREGVKITLAELGSKQANSIHMVMGMSAEQGEIILAIRKDDPVNLGEELTDVAWFGTSYGNINELNTNIEIRTIVINGFNPITIADKVENWLYKLFNKTSLKYPLMFNDYFTDLIINISDLTDLEKKEYAYKKPQYDIDRTLALNKLYDTLSWCYYFAGLDAEDCMQKNYDKLMVRYNKKKFDSDHANNRNLDAERQALEGTLLITEK